VSLTSTADTTSVLDEYFDTWLTSKGWSTSKFLGTNTKFYYASKNIQLFGGSTKRFGICLQYEFSSSNEVFNQIHFGSDETPSSSGPSGSPYHSDSVSTNHTGQWNFWTDSQDSDCFAIITASGKVVAFWPPEGTLTGTAYNGARASNQPSQPITPLLINNVSLKNYFIDTYQGGGKIYPIGTYPSFPDTFTVPTAFYNYGFAVANSGGLYMYDTSGRTATYVEDYTSASPYIDDNSGTLQVGTIYYIRLGGNNSILLNCGTTDPGV
ncbi:MAG: hypothetical protein VW879_13910, partial [Opitutae bacterium]